ncbi:TPA: hypothetical protein QB112_002001 [Pasteurella multocida]|nr:hypothetical protein [Pasteurella multocida]
MKRIIILDDSDFIEPPKPNQPIHTFKLKDCDIDRIESNFDIIIYNNNYIKNRFGNLSDDIKLDKLI